jgi:hypothetical protein
MISFIERYKNQYTMTPFRTPLSLFRVRGYEDEDEDDMGIHRRATPTPTPTPIYQKQYTPTGIRTISTRRAIRTQARSDYQEE